MASSQFANLRPQRLFERGAKCVGLDFLAHPFWDKYIEFEERLEEIGRIFTILGRLIDIPMHQYARYYERYRQLAASRPVAELGAAEQVSQFRAEVEMEGGASQSEAQVEAAVRAKFDANSYSTFQRCQTETTKRWTYEQEIKRPYFHVTDLDEAQLTNWNKYLDFEESEGSRERVAFLYERCLIAAAYYEEFWLRYARWMLAQGNKTEETRNIYQRASCFYVPIARPAVRLQWALFEEMSGRVDVAHAIYEAMLETLPGHNETIVAWASSARRTSGVDAAAAVFKSQVEAADIDNTAKATLLCEWARLLWKIKASPDEARALFQQSTTLYSGSREFWESYLLFEVEQPPNPAQNQLVVGVYEQMKALPQLDEAAKKELSQVYMTYLLERGGKDAAKEYLTLDRALHGY